MLVNEASVCGGVRKPHRDASAHPFEVELHPFRVIINAEDHGKPDSRDLEGCPLEALATRLQIASEVAKTRNQQVDEYRRKPPIRIPLGVVHRHIGADRSWG